MTQVDYKDRLSGSASAVATSYLVGTAPVKIAVANDARICLTVQPDANVFVGLASSFNASSAAIGYVGSGGYYQERDYRGEVWAKTEGATAVIRRFEV